MFFLLFISFYQLLSVKNGQFRIDGKVVGAVFSVDLVVVLLVEINVYAVGGNEDVVKNAVTAGGEVTCDLLGCSKVDLLVCNGHAILKSCTVGDGCNNAAGGLLVEVTAASDVSPAKMPITTTSAALYKSCNIPVNIIGSANKIIFLKSGP